MELEKALVIIGCLAVAGFLFPSWCYVVARKVSKAYFESKREFFKELQHGIWKEEG